MVYQLAAFEGDGLQMPDKPKLLCTMETEYTSSPLPNAIPEAIHGRSAASLSRQKWVHPLRRAADHDLEVPGAAMRALDEERGVPRGMGTR